MAGLIAPNVCRYTLNGTYAGRPVANVMDLYIDNNDNGDRIVLIPAVAEVLIQSWIDNILENVADNYTCDNASWVDMNNANGSVGTATDGTTTNLPQSGTSTGDATPGNVAVRVNKNIVARRGQRQGRMYLVGLTEAQTADGAPNSPSAAYIAALNADLITLVDDLTFTVTVGAITADVWPAVVHTKDMATPPDPPDIQWVATSQITSMTVDPTLSSQRRRLRG